MLSIILFSKERINLTKNNICNNIYKILIIQRLRIMILKTTYNKYYCLENNYYSKNNEIKVLYHIIYFIIFQIAQFVSVRFPYSFVLFQYILNRV